MSTHSSILAWEIPRTEEPGGLQSVGLQKQPYRTWQLNNNPSTSQSWGVQQTMDHASHGQIWFPVLQCPRCPLPGGGERELGSGLSDPVLDM